MAVTDHESCSPIARAHAVEQLAALTAAASAEMLEVIAAMDRAEDHRIDGAIDMQAWLVATLHIASATAAQWVRVARALHQLPHLRARHAAGELSWDQIAAATRFATPDTDQLLAEALPGCTAAQIEEMARERTTRARRDAQRSHEERSLRWRKDHTRDGYRYSGFLSAAEAEIVNAALERRAEHAGRDPQTGVWAPFSQRCTDGLVDQCRQALDVDPGPDPSMVVVHVDADVLDGVIEGNGSTAATEATAASPAVAARSATSTTSTGGSATPAQPTHGTWPDSAGNTTTSSTKAAGPSRATPTNSSPSPAPPADPPHPTPTPPPPDPPTHQRHHQHRPRPPRRPLSRR